MWVPNHIMWCVRWQGARLQQVVAQGAADAAVAELDQTSRSGARLRSSLLAIRAASMLTSAMSLTMTATCTCQRR